MKQPSGLLRRFGAILYDALLVIALWFLATIPFIAIRGGEAVEPEAPAYQVMLLAVVYAFLVGFWCRRGSTLGMLAWGLRVENEDGSLPSIAQGSIRFCVAPISLLPLGLGYFWQLWDDQRQSWHDKFSKTRLMYYPKEKQ